MKYSVLWVREAERELASLWLNQSERAEVTRAANEIDRRLRNDPSDQGESRVHNLRILIEPPLGVTFEVRQQDRTVLVLDVWRFKTR